MRTFFDLVTKTNGAALRLVHILERKIAFLKHFGNIQNDRQARLDAEETITIHQLEVAQDRRVVREIRRRGTLNDSDLRLDLEKQYGKTKWSKKVIDDLLQVRVEGHNACVLID